ncbi:MAG: FtsX-like permease family protein [Acidobacteriaceae bacterium]|nr:FtsX-like permease family protein [Acidobacteriaceae bacterium]
MVRPLLREPMRHALTIFAVALGVGVVIAMDLASQAAALSFHSSAESLIGNTDLLITGTGGLDEHVLGRLVALPYAFEFTPRIEDFAFLNGKGEALPFIGLDLVAHSNFARENEFARNNQFRGGNLIWTGPGLSLHSGDRVELLINDTLHPFTVAGVLNSHETGARESNLIIADIGLAQRVTGRIGRLDSIAVRVPSQHSIDYWRKLIAQHLPPTLTVAPVGLRTEENQKMLAAFRSNLRVLSYISLIVGAFLIYNTISISVIRRRSEIGVVRALGATRAMIASAFIAEALFFGATGGVLGIAIGRALANGAAVLIGNTVHALYVTGQSAPATLTAHSAAAGIALGFMVSILGSLAPAYEAARVPPVEAMARRREQYVAQVRSRGALVWAVVMFLTAAVLSKMPPIDRQPICAYVAVLLLIAGTALAIPNFILWIANAANRIIGKLLGAEGLLAMRSLRGSLGRTAVVTAALATAVAMATSVDIMVGSFRETVWLWINGQLTADFYLRPAGSGAADRHPTINTEIADRIEHLPGISAVDRFRAYAISYEGLPATLAGSEASRVPNASALRFLPGENTDAILRKLPTGDYAIVSEPFANKHHVAASSVLELPLGAAIHSFQVLGIYYDYSTERGFILLDRRVLLSYLPDPAASSLAVYLKPAVNANSVRHGIDRVLSGHAVMVSPSSSLRRGALQVFDRTFRITYALEAIAIIVAVLGIAGSLLAMVLDRRREFGLLRLLGSAQQQVRRIILCEAGLLGLMANGIGLVLGTLLSLILIFVINKQSFGWTIQFYWPLALLVFALTAVFIATVVAGLYPALIATRANPIEVIHEE